MPKSAKRVAAGKKRWAAMSAGAKAKVLARLKRMRAGSTSPAPRGAKTNRKVNRVAKKRRSRGRGSLINGAANLGLLVLAFSRAIQLALGTVSPSIGGSAMRSITYEASAGLSDGRFDKDAAARFYGPVVAAFVLFEVKKLAMQKFGRSLPM